MLSLLKRIRKPPPKTVFDIDRFLKLQSIDELSVSPDGSFIAYTVTHRDEKKDVARESVWMQSTSDNELIQLTSNDGSNGDASHPKWSPDGRFLAVLSDRDDETSQVWLFDRRGGDPKQLTTLKQGVESFVWSPNGEQLVLVVEDPTPADLDDEKKPNPRPYVIDRLQFKEDYVGYLDRHRTHLHVLDITSKNLRQVTFGDFDDAQPAWAPDNQRIVFVSSRSASPDSKRNTDLWLVDSSVDNTEAVQLTTTESSDESPAWSPDGTSIVYTATTIGGPQVYAIPQLATLSVSSGESAVVEALLEVQAIDPRFSNDGQSLFAITEQRGEQNLVQVDVSSGNVERLISGENVVTEFEIGGNGSIFALVTQPDLPDEVFQFRDGNLLQISTINRSVLEDVTLAPVEKHTYRGSEDVALDVFIVFPPDFERGKPCPGLLHIHGGPQSQWDFGFNSEAQLLAAQGYVVVMPNPRGSFGYGQEFAAAIYQDWGGIDFDDVMASIDFAIDEGWVDDGRLAVYGWSYGGMMTNHVITKSDRFKAAISGASATLYVANYGHDQYQRWWEEELGLPWLKENREKWDSISPFYALDKVSTPTLIVGGEDDWNVPIINSEQLYIGLKRQGVATELIIYPGEGHELSIPSYEKHLYERYLSWLDTHVR